MKVHMGPELLNDDRKAHFSKESQKHNTQTIPFPAEKKKTKKKKFSPTPALLPALCRPDSSVWVSEMSSEPRSRRSDTGPGGCFTTPLDL
ncbi:unnamed protein product [Gadus morhua 'NCC']